MVNLIKPYLIEALLSDFTLNTKRKYAEKKRIIGKLSHQVTVYIAIDDPYSYLLLQTLVKLQKQFGLKYDFKTVLNKPKDMYPEPELWEENAFQDGRFLADLYQLNFPEKPPAASKNQTITATAQLLHNELKSDYLTKALIIFSNYWLEGKCTPKTLIEPIADELSGNHLIHLSCNEVMLKKNGHYQSAMLHYAGEWYWGLDRLQHLENRLNDLQPLASQKIHFNKTYNIHQSEKALTAGDEKNSPLMMYWSIRSPYSYIALLRAKRLAAYFQVPFVVKPILPMVMRGMQVPKSKAMYIIKDAKREAKSLDIPFGKIADPLGKGVERCYALYEYAASKKLAVEFLLTYAESVWSKGICSETDSGLKYIIEKTGLDWLEAKKHINDSSWKSWAQSNLLELYQHNKWGVPSLNYENLTVFGQDRLLQIQQAIVQSKLKPQSKN